MFCIRFSFAQASAQSIEWYPEDCKETQNELLELGERQLLKFSKLSPWERTHALFSG